MTLAALAVAGCQTASEEPTARMAGIMRHGADDRPGSHTRSANGMALFDNSRGGLTTVIEGTGRFVGEPPTGSVPTTKENVENGVTLNLVGVPTAQAAKTVLGDILAVRYTVDPNIEGKVTIQTPQPVSRQAALDLFQTSLRANGAAIINSKGQYRIVPADKAAVGASIRVEPRHNFRDEAETESARISSGLQVVQLRYVAASEIRRVLEPIAPRGGIVRVDDARNLITLSGSSQEIASMMEAIALFDVDVMRGMSFALVPVKTSQPDVIAKEARTVFAADREGPMAGMVQFLPNKRLSSILVISPQAQYLARADEWIRRLDAQAEGSEKQLFTYAAQNRRAGELLKVLQSMFAAETGGAAAAMGRNVAPGYQEASLRSGSSFGQGLSGTSSATGLGAMSSTGMSGTTQSRSLPGVTSEKSPGSDITGTVQMGVDRTGEGPRIRLAADEGKNAVLIEATPADYRRLMRVMSVLDSAPKQVLIEATIAEISLTDELKFGVRWRFKDGKNNIGFTDAVSGAVSAISPGFSYAITAGNVAASLHALSAITEVNIVSSPSLTVMDNRPAILQVGDQVPITTQSALVAGGAGAPIINSVSYRDTGVILGITPQINESGRVSLDIEQEVSSVVNTTTSTIDSPTIRQRRIHTNVAVNDGEALILGGLIQDSRTVSRTQVPLLGDIPLLGNAFKTKTNEMGKTELIVIITPHVLRDSRDARRITEEFKRELMIYAPQRIKRHRSLENTARRMFD